MRFLSNSFAIAVVLATGAGVAGASAAIAQQAPVYTGWLSKVAVGGYDPVAYFRQGKPVKGNARFAFSWQGAEYRFASAANRDDFRADPGHYAPRYGGYCAWAVAHGYTAPGDPKAWTIVKDRLYLNYDADVRRQWSKDIPRYIADANRNWPGVLGK
ncbi:YHS domain-containing (seleno)protein [Sphingomonas sp.]|uniref:YHS domain-containing (seleno)protein n=1 Tax=Sphingomonas sp. TaxID=28214 RepID=UPI001B14DA28|nr:YHS domain-containing (seleno)protein [Sphingomonas sp.]MBO9711685.1 YHS domain-containing protein [Sphingomonas sp.]